MVTVYKISHKRLKVCRDAITFTKRGAGFVSIVYMGKVDLAYLEKSMVSSTLTVGDRSWVVTLVPVQYDTHTQHNEYWLMSKDDLMILFDTIKGAGLTDAGDVSAFLENATKRIKINNLTELPC